MLTLLLWRRSCADCVAIAFTAADIDSRSSAVEAEALVPVVVVVVVGGMDE